MTNTLIEKESKLRFLTYDEQLDFVDKKLATVSVNGNLSTFKYAKRVMYDYLWDKYPALRACRGHTYDNATGEVVTCPPMKSFNYLENDWWGGVSLDTPVIAYKKYNGFMAAATKVNGEVVVSTTGSTKSDHAAWAKATMQFAELSEGVTTLCEVVLPEDPHIVQESFYGAIVLGEMHENNTWLPSAVGANAQRGTLQEILAIAKKDRGEGFMVYRLDSGGNPTDIHNPCKIKSDYYVGKKKIMRAGIKTVEKMYNQTHQFLDTVPFMWDEVVYNIKSEYSQQEWLNTSEQERRKVIELMIG